ncbi:Carboxypeptidase A4, partial [Trichinella zimbabwensis]
MRNQLCQQTNLPIKLLNFWTEIVRTNSPVDVMIPEKSVPYIEKLCQMNNIMYKIIIENVHKLIQEKKAMAEKRKKFSRTFKDFVGSKRPLYDHSDYQSYNKMYRFMEALENAYPENAKVLTLGKTRNGKPIYMIKIAENLNASGKKGFWINAGIHAREWASSSTAIMENCFFLGLIWYIVPLLNVDGYEFTRRNTHPDVRLWRKNRSPAECLNNGQCCRGVDLNRNFNFNFGGQGSSTDPCDETFQGPFAFIYMEHVTKSEAELIHYILLVVGWQTGKNQLQKLNIQLRPDEWVYDGFILDQAQILPTARETWQGIKVVADAVLRETHKASIRSG